MYRKHGAKCECEMLNNAKGESVMLRKATDEIVMLFRGTSPNRRYEHHIIASTHIK